MCVDFGQTQAKKQFENNQHTNQIKLITINSPLNRSQYIHTHTNATCTLYRKDAYVCLPFSGVSVPLTVNFIIYSVWICTNTACSSIDQFNWIEFMPILYIFHRAPASNWSRDFVMPRVCFRLLLLLLLPLFFFFFFFLFEFGRIDKKIERKKKKTAHWEQVPICVRWICKYGQLVCAHNYLITKLALIFQLIGSKTN